MENKGISYIETEVWTEHNIKPGYLQKVRNKTIKEVYEEVKQFLIEQNIYDDLDYFLISVYRENEEFPEWRWMACYAVTGDSEGHYVHVDVLPFDGPPVHVFTAKTFLGINHALKVSNLLTKVFYNEMS